MRVFEKFEPESEELDVFGEKITRMSNSQKSPREIVMTTPTAAPETMCKGSRYDILDMGI